MKKYLTLNKIFGTVIALGLAVLVVNQIATHFMKEDSSFEYYVTNDGDVRILTDDGGTLVPLEGTDLYECVRDNRFDMLRGGTYGRLLFKDVVQDGRWLRHCWVEPFPGVPQTSHSQHIRIGKPI